MEWFERISKSFHNRYTSLRGFEPPTYRLGAPNVCSISWYFLSCAVKKYPLSKRFFRTFESNPVNQNIVKVKPCKAKSISKKLESANIRQKAYGQVARLTPATILDRCNQEWCINMKIDWMLLLYHLSIRLSTNCWLPTIFIQWLFSCIDYLYVVTTSIQIRAFYHITFFLFYIFL